MPLLIAAPVALALPGAARAGTFQNRERPAAPTTSPPTRWTVPAGVTDATLVVQGQRGGGGNGGLGAEITTTIELTPGDVCYFCLGAGGDAGRASTGSLAGQGGAGGVVTARSDPQRHCAARARRRRRRHGRGPGGGAGGNAAAPPSRAPPAAQSGVASGGASADDSSKPAPEAPAQRRLDLHRQDRPRLRRWGRWRPHRRRQWRQRGGGGGA